LDFLIPRLDADGKAVSEYAYQVPQTLTDGWPIGDLRKSPLDPKSVERGVGKILQQRFPNIQGLVVVQKGKLLLDQYFYGFGPSDAHQLQSATKSVLSILFGIAQGQGLVNVQDKLYDYFPEYRSKPGWSEDKNKITLGHLLSMSSGLACDDWLPPGDNCNAEMWKTQDWLSFDLSLPLAYKPGEHFAYTTSCMELLGAVLARKSGMSVPDFGKKVLWDPLGIQAPSWFAGPNQVTEVGGSLQLRPRDMAKLGQLYLQKGKWNGQSAVPEKWVEASTRPQAPNPKENPR
jgi:CubicO group peptidase (beta-lactamase class C family)